ncbi:MAG: GntR family transcriptional regulator [Verrucomicrobiales bacterium]|nr:GntR family transcriptional regulator [Verrucomicrobiales bacterium]
MEDSVFTQSADKSAKISDVVLRELEAMIMDGRLSTGAKLPPERELAEQFGVSRPTLREALQKMEAKGLLDHRQGGGNFIRQHTLGELADPLFDLISKNREAQYDLLEYRFGIDGMAAYYAAMRGNEEDFALISEKFALIDVVQLESDVRLEAEAVYAFHLAISVASQNRVLEHLARSMEPLLKSNIEQNLLLLAQRPDSGNKVNHYRQKLFDKIVSGEPDKAWAASRRHLSYIEEVLLAIRDDNSRIEHSLRRMQHS